MSLAVEADYYVIVKQKEKDILFGKGEDVREKIEEMLSEHLGGMDIMLQEYEEEGSYYVYLHTETEDMITDQEYERLCNLNITDEPYGTTEAISKMLDLSFVVVN